MGTGDGIRTVRNEPPPEPRALDPSPYQPTHHCGKGTSAKTALQIPLCSGTLFQQGVETDATSITNRSDPTSSQTHQPPTNMHSVPDRKITEKAAQESIREQEPQLPESPAHRSLWPTTGGILRGVLLLHGDSRRCNQKGVDVPPQKGHGRSWGTPTIPTHRSETTKHGTQGTQSSNRSV